MSDNDLADDINSILGITPEDEGTGGKDTPKIDVVPEPKKVPKKLKKDGTISHRGEGNSKYKPEYVEQVFNMKLLGLTNEEIAKVLDINQDTFYLWMTKYRKLSEAVKEGGAKADARVVKSLYDRAMGFNGKDGVYYPPEPKALSFWLRNRQPKIWREKQEVQHSGTISIASQIKQAYDEIKAPE